MLIALLLVMLMASFARAADKADPKPPAFRAKITLTDVKPDGTKVVMASPTVVYLPGAECRVVVDSKTGRRFSATLANNVKKHPDQHRLVARLGKVNAAGVEWILTAPKIVVKTGRAGSIYVGSEPGPGFEIQLLVERVAAKR